MAIVLEQFQADQADELVRMWRESFEHGVGVTDPHPIAEQRDALVNEVVERNEVRIAVLDGRIVGFVASTPESVAQLYVRKGFHRRGIGSQLLQWAKDRSRGSLWLYTFSRNSVACAFYEKHGFRAVARGFEPNWKLDDVRYEWKASAQPVLRSTITCPSCGARTEEEMPTDACVFFYECKGCGTLLRPRKGDCCVFCSYGSVKCPPVQMEKGCCA